MWQKIIYDIYGKNHCANLESIGFTLDSLENGSFIIYEGEKALHYYNNKFPAQNFLIPEKLVTYDIYKLLIYIQVVNNVEYIIALICIETDILKKFVETNTILPEQNFIIKMLKCSKHFDVSLPYNSPDEKINGYVNFIVEKALTASDYTNDMQIENIPNMNIKLFDYQKCSIKWMLEKEKAQTKVYYNIRKELVLGDVYFDNYIGKFNLKTSRSNITFNGGALIDEVGLGKTIQMISLALLNPYVANSNDSILKSKATLIICPNQLCTQWENEIKNRLSNYDSYKIVKITTKNDLNKRIITLIDEKGNKKKDVTQTTYKTLLEADFVILSYTFLDNPIFTKKWIPLISDVKSFHKKEWDTNTNISVANLFDTMKKKILLNESELTEPYPLVQLLDWHRVIVDEFHESYSKVEYKYIKNIIRHIKGTYKWCVTATPFTDNMQGILNTTNYVTNYEAEIHGKEMLNDENMLNYLSNDLFRRNTKKSVEEIEKFKIPPTQEEVLWLKFSVTERMIYNANLANPKNDKYSVYLRQLCCHPQLADETKYALSNCKSLLEIEKIMSGIYKDEVVVAKQKVFKIKKRIFITKIKNIIDYQKHVKPKGDVQKKKPTFIFPSQYVDFIKKYGENGEKITDLDVTTYNQEHEEITALIFKHNEKDKCQKYIDTKNYLISLEEKLKEANNVLNGKQTTSNFFTNVIEKLRKTQTSSKPKKSFSYDLDASDSEDEDEDDDSEICGICLDTIPEEDIGVTKCGHIFCYSCLKMVVDTKHKCPLCSIDIKNDEVYTLSYERKAPTNMTKNDTELLNTVGTKLANLIFFLRKVKEHCIIFSQWDDLLIKVGKILLDNGIKNVFCKGNCYQRDKAIREFTNSNDIKVIMLSSSNTASGTNLTKASRVIFLDPIYGDYDYRRSQERQAIGRAHRMGQLNTVIINRLIIRETIENEIYNTNIMEDLKHIENKNVIIKEIDIN